MRNWPPAAGLQTQEATILFVPFKIPEMQRLSYDLSPLQDLTVPVIWLLGAIGSGRDTQAKTMEDAYGFDVIKVGDLLRKHSSNETDRGRVIKENLVRINGYIPNTIIIDLLKEEMLSRARWTCGYVLNGFPRNIEQADMFVEEIKMVDVILLLHTEYDIVLQRLMERDERKLNMEKLRGLLNDFQKEVKKLKKYGAKIEKFDTSKCDVDQTFGRIQSALNVRVFGDVNFKNMDD